MRSFARTRTEQGNLSESQAVSGNLSLITRGVCPSVDLGRIALLSIGARSWPSPRLSLSRMPICHSLIADYLNEPV
jgi:hypothetical protein